MAVNDQIRRLRLVRGITQEYVADLLNINSSTFGKMERGQLEFRFGYIERIADHFGLSVHELIEYDQIEKGRIPASISNKTNNTAGNNVEITLQLRDLTDTEIKQLLQELQSLGKHKQ